MAGLFGRLAVIMCATMPFYAAARAGYIKKKKPPHDILREVVLCLFFVFMAGLLALVLWPGRLFFESGPAWQVAWRRLAGMADVNLTPFATIGRFFANGWNVGFAVNIVANVLMFSPFGLCLPLLWRRWQNAFKVLGAGVLLSASIEFLQLFIARATDVDDIILNVAGVMLGYAVYKVLAAILPAAGKLAAARRRRA